MPQSTQEAAFCSPRWARTTQEYGQALCNGLTVHGAGVVSNRLTNRRLCTAHTWICVCYRVHSTTNLLLVHLGYIKVRDVKEAAGLAPRTPNSWNDGWCQSELAVDNKARGCGRASEKAARCNLVWLGRTANTPDAAHVQGSRHASVCGQQQGV